MVNIDYSLMYYVTDDRIVDDNTDFFYVLEKSLEGGVSIIQLREKSFKCKTIL